MMRADIEISKVLLQEAKRQFYSGEITLTEYNEALELIFNKLSELENNWSGRDYILQNIGNPNFKMKIKDTINYSLSMN